MAKALLPPDTSMRINVFVHRLQQMLNEHYAPRRSPKVCLDTRGRVKLRVYLDWTGTGRKWGGLGGSLAADPREVYCFIRVNDGALLRATGWSNVVYAEPLVSRITDGDFGLSNCTPFGVNYFQRQSDAPVP